MSSDDGHAAVEFAMAVGVLLLPVALVIVSFGPWLERRVTAEAAAAEGVRAAVLGLDVAAGSATASDVAESSGLDGRSVRIGWCGASPAAPPAGECGFVRGAAVEVEVEVWTPLLNTPWGPVGGFWVSGHHGEPIDLYRSLE